VGLDVHQKRMAVAVARKEGGEPEWWGTIPNEPKAVAKLVGRLGDPERLVVCYEAGPCGYTLQRQWAQWGATCVVVAPSLTPTKPGDRVKTDRRDALKLARLLRSGELTSVWAPDPEQEALRDLTRAREAAKVDVSRVKQRISKMLLRLGINRPEGMKGPWTQKHRRWLGELTFASKAQQLVWGSLLLALEQGEARLKQLEEALPEAASSSRYGSLIGGLQCLKGVGLITAVTLVAELGDVVSRFPTARSLMGYAGLGVEEWSSGERQVRGRITKAGNKHVRFVAVEAGWHAQHSGKAGKAVRQRRAGQPEAVVAIAEEAQERLHRRFRHLVQRGKARPCAATAVARELLGFVWALAQTLAREDPQAAMAA
jgi:transposase